ncbi:hypothetical protein ABPG72_019834 [Tetrahymena utriculariae]
MGHENFQLANFLKILFYIQYFEHDLQETNNLQQNIQGDLQAEQKHSLECDPVYDKLKEVLILKQFEELGLSKKILVQQNFKIYILESYYHTYIQKKQLKNQRIYNGGYIQARGINKLPLAQNYYAGDSVLLIYTFYQKQRKERVQNNIEIQVLSNMKPQSSTPISQLERGIVIGLKISSTTNLNVQKILEENKIEKVWSLLKHKINKNMQDFQNLQQLKDFTQQTLLNDSEIKNLISKSIESIPNYLSQIITNNGDIPYTQFKYQKSNQKEKKNKTNEQQLREPIVPNQKKFKINFNELNEEDILIPIQTQRQYATEQLQSENLEKNLLPKASIWNQNNCNTNKSFIDTSQILNKKQIGKNQEIDMNIQANTIQQKDQQCYQKNNNQQNQSHENSISDDIDSDYNLKAQPYKKMKQNQAQIIANDFQCDNADKNTYQADIVYQKKQEISKQRNRQQNKNSNTYENDTQLKAKTQKENQQNQSQIIANNSESVDASQNDANDEVESSSQDVDAFVTKIYGEFLCKNEADDEINSCIKLAKDQLLKKAKLSQEKAAKMKKKFPKLFCLIHKKLQETEEKYAQHTIKHHPDIAQQENLTQFKCLKCLKTFVTYGWWEKHVIICQGLREKLAQLSNSNKKLFLLGLSMKNNQ